MKFTRLFSLPPLPVLPGFRSKKDIWTCIIQHRTSIEHQLLSVVIFSLWLKMVNYGEFIILFISLSWTKRCTLTALINYVMSLYIFQTVQRGSAWDDEGRSPSVEGRGWRHKNGGRERTKNRGGTQTFRLYEFSCLCPFFLLFTFPSLSISRPPFGGESFKSQPYFIAKSIIRLEAQLWYA